MSDNISKQRRLLLGAIGICLVGIKPTPAFLPQPSDISVTQTNRLWRPVRFTDLSDQNKKTSF